MCATAELEQSWLERTCSQNSGLSASLREKYYQSDDVAIKLKSSHTHKTAIELKFESDLGTRLMATHCVCQ